LDTKSVFLICLCYVGNATSAQIAYAIRRIRRKAPDAFIIVSLFGNDESIEGLDRQGDIGVALQSLHAIVDEIVAAVIRLDVNSSLATLDSPPPLVATKREASHING
jgi:hypothetical protein